MFLKIYMCPAISIHISDYSTKNCNINIVTIKVIDLLVIRALIKINYQNKPGIYFQKNGTFLRTWKRLNIFPL